jgi:gluconokinase
MVIVVMGAAGAGKTTVGRALAVELGWRFIEGDDYHPASNVAKMQAGVPLTDEERAPWLAALVQAVARAFDRREHTVVTCSALKERDRLALRDACRQIRFVYLKADERLLEDRLSRRGGHFFNPALVRSQLAALEEPDDQVTIRIDAALPPEQILATIRRELGV